LSRCHSSRTLVDQTMFCANTRIKKPATNGHGFPLQRDIRAVPWRKLEKETTNKQTNKQINPYSTLLMFFSFIHPPSFLTVHKENK